MCIQQLVAPGGCNGDYSDRNHHHADDVHDVTVDGVHSADGDHEADSVGLPAHYNHDKNPPRWDFVGNEYSGNMPVTKSHH